ncbi:hypothetical protein DSO57_1031856 [Entomophthora muscae]|uniref:Uncharacterized protein n=1 Tax=Entomophthora muscae TaxID=34485 RepID=A0ACC2SPU0_9FUNG|nr:hypothetical protein DSO57_1031856 [Entomophthora muscae]
MDTAIKQVILSARGREFLGHEFTPSYCHCFQELYIPKGGQTLRDARIHSEGASRESSEGDFRDSGIELDCLKDINLAQQVPGFETGYLMATSQEQELHRVYGGLGDITPTVEMVGEP